MERYKLDPEMIARFLGEDTYTDMMNMLSRTMNMYDEDDTDIENQVMKSIDEI